MNINVPSSPIHLYSHVGSPDMAMPACQGLCPDSEDTKTNRSLFILIVLCLVLLVLSVLIMAAVPPTSRDALTHHLAVPKLWIEKGGMVEMPDLDFSYYPMNLDLLYVIPMLFGNDILPKYIHFLFALATAWLIYAYLKQRTTRNLSLGGALLFLSTPVIVKLSISVYVDLGLIFFSWASMFHLLAWARHPHAAKHLVFSAILCGLGLGTKYNGIIVLFLLTLFVPIIYIQTEGRNQFKTKCAVGYPVLFFLIATTVFSPWMIRNYRSTGNPIYPLYKDRIGSQTERSEISNLSMKPWLQRKLIYRESAWETTLIPLRVFFQGEDDNPRFFDGKLNPVLFFCPFLLLLRRRESDAAMKLDQLLLTSFSILFVLYASFMVDMRIRYIAPIIPPLVVLSILGIRDILLWGDGLNRKSMQVISRWVLAGCMFYFLSMNATYVANVFRSVNPVPFILGKTSRSAYLTDKLPEYPAIQFANQITDEDMKILALFLGRRLYYFDRTAEFATQAFARMVAASTDGKTLSSQLRDSGYSHCIIGISHFENWANQVFANEHKKDVLQWLRNDCKLLFSENGYAVFKLIPNGAIHSSGHQKGNVE